MTYATGGLIQASDFNNLVGGSAANVSGQLNCVLGVGNRDVGYGQTTVSNVAQYNKVYATDWASMINKLNSVRQHQTGSGSSITAPSTGNLIQYISTLSSSITSSYTSRLTYASSGSTTTGSNYTTNMTAPETSGNVSTITRTITFASGNAARYFFNAGGKLTLVVTANNNNATARSASIVTLCSTNFNSDSMNAITYSGRSGSGGTATVNLTSGSTAGYYGLTTSPTNRSVVTITSTSYYTGDYLQLTAASNGTQGSNADNGSVIYFNLTLFSSADGSSQPADDLDVTITTRVDITPPETTYLSNSWGTITVS